MTTNNARLWAQRIFALILIIASVAIAAWTEDGGFIIVTIPLGIWMFFTRELEIFPPAEETDIEEGTNSDGYGRHMKPATQAEMTLDCSESELERASDYVTDLMRTAPFYSRDKMIDMTLDRYDVPRAIVEWMVP